MNNLQHNTRLKMAATVLRIGLGLVFVIGGWSKLNQLLGTPGAHDAIVALYMGPSGYINVPFQNYLFFAGSPLSPSAFLTTLSAFELVSGISLVAGLLVRPLALFYGFLLWTFVISLPTHTVPGVAVAVETYTSPAILVQIRDIALSGMMFVLFNLGSGAASLDRRLFHTEAAGSAPANWDTLGLLLRFSLGMVFLVAGFFGSFAHVATYASDHMLLAAIGVGLVLGSNNVVRVLGATTAVLMLWFMAHKLNLDKSVIANLNAFKREFALLAASVVLAWRGGGHAFTLLDLVRRGRRYVGAKAVTV